MDVTRFDRLARTLGKPIARRGIVGALLALSVAGIAESASRCVRFGGACSRKKRCCAGAACRAGRCACAANLSRCSGACVDTGTSAAHCGGCGKSCAAGLSCVQGTCRLVCPAGQVNCGGSCVDLGTNANHCGGCQTQCGSGLICISGACTTPPPCNGACGSNEVCVAGSCARDCVAAPASCTIQWDSSASNVTMRVLAGSTVRWSGSAGQHPLRVASGAIAVDSPSANLQTASFPDTGDYPFLCTQHGSMNGTITVVARP